jgi:hypothetical protein
MSSKILTFEKKYDGRLNFATDAWTSPNQRAFVAVTVHLEHQGEPISMLLDIVEVAKSHTGENLASAFAKILEDYGISDKVLISTDYYNNFTDRLTSYSALPATTHRTMMPWLIAWLQSLQNFPERPIVQDVLLTSSIWS